MLITLKKYLITGGTGSWGHALVAELLKGYDTGDILIYSRNEYLQVMMARQFTDPRVKYYLSPGSVEARSSL
jgi:FlaA1/EpsC-like NDP-sugar epimerase